MTNPSSNAGRTRGSRARPAGCVALAGCVLLALTSHLNAQETRLEQLVDSLRALKSQPPSPEPPPPAPEGPPVPYDTSGPQHIPLQGAAPSDNLQVSGKDGRVTVIARDAPTDQVLDLLARTHGLNLITTSASAAGKVSISLRDVPIEVAIDSIVSIAGMTWVRRDDVILVTAIDASNVIPDVQNRELRIFELDYASVEDVQAAVQQMLSPNGKSSIHQTVAQNVRQTKNVLVVEDLPAYVNRIEEYIEQIDQPPRQVLIEARVLQINLTDNYLHGVNLLYQFGAGQGSTLSLATKGFANAAASQAVLFTLASSNLNALVELLESSTDAKTLASPRVLCVNGQEARIQVGGQLGFRVLTTTQTSTLEQVQFLDTGVILRVTPYITRDNQVLLRVTPEVSTGQINAQGLPESQTTTVETQVLLPDNQGMIIGGLIQENYSDRQKKLPVLGDVFIIGRFFQRREVDRSRTEVIIALLPRIVPYDCQTSRRDRDELARTDAPIFSGDLARNPRPWEPRVYDACENPRCLKELLPWDRRMRPRKGTPTIFPYPTDPASRTCIEEDVPGFGQVLLDPNESCDDGNVIVLPDVGAANEAVPGEMVPIAPEPPPAAESTIVVPPISTKKETPPPTPGARP